MMPARDPLCNCPYYMGSHLGKWLCPAHGIVTQVVPEGYPCPYCGETIEENVLMGMVLALASIRRKEKIKIIIQEVP